MRKHGKRILALLLTTTLLTGCGKKKVTYSDKAADDSNATLESQLALNGLEMWKENITSKAGDIQLNCSIEVPDTTTMYTYTVHERYLTNEDKKNIMTYFVDESTIKVNTIFENTKEDCQRTIDYLQEFSEEYDIPIPQFDLNYYQYRYETAISESELTEDVGDYSMHNYIGEKGSNDYYFCFGVDPTYNVSYFTLNRQSKMFSDPVVPENTEENVCGMTEEEAKTKALSILSDLGINNMMVASIEEKDVYYYDDEYADGFEGKYHWHDGYKMVITRDINGVCSEYNNFCYSDTYGERGYAQTKPYSSERILMTIDSEGIEELVCGGIMDEGSLNSSVKLLSFDKVQQIIRDYLTNSDVEWYVDSWPTIRLTYMRVENMSVMDEYTYIPVWCIFRGILTDESNYQKCYDDVIIVNAIDGKVMDPIEDGLVSEYTSQSTIDFE